MVPSDQHNNPTRFAGQYSFQRGVWCVGKLIIWNMSKGLRHLAPPPNQQPFHYISHHHLVGKTHGPIQSLFHSNGWVQGSGSGLVPKGRAYQVIHFWEGQVLGTDLLSDYWPKPSLKRDMKSNRQRAWHSRVERYLKASSFFFLPLC